MTGFQILRTIFVPTVAVIATVHSCGFRFVAETIYGRGGRDCGNVIDGRPRSEWACRQNAGGKSGRPKQHRYRDRRHFRFRRGRGEPRR